MAEVNVQLQNRIQNLTAGANDLVAATPKQKELLIIDCDAGNDDALAILYATNRKLAETVDILGITCVGGNTILDNVVGNVLRTLKIAKREDIPVYKGAVTGVISRDLLRKTFTHGSDGLGGVANFYPVAEAEIQAVLRRENAVDFIGRTIMQYPPGAITLVTLGPLTNVAFAHRLFPEFHTRLKRLVVMGGNLDSKGNMGLTSEFNFGCDPEAAYAVLHEFACPITLIPFDMCLLHYFKFDWYESMLSSVNSIKTNFVQQIFQGKVDWLKSTYKGLHQWYACDWLAMICAVGPEDIIQQRVFQYAAVELQGALTRGQMVVDWKDTLHNVGGRKQKIEIVTRMDLAKLQLLFEETISE